MQFIVADLTDARLAAQTGGGFDFISCHGVLSYIAHPERVLANLAACARAGGVLYLGVNSAGHPSTCLRRWLPQFGVEVDALREERRMRALLRLWDALHPGLKPALGGLSASYLASDVCGPHFNNWSLARLGERRHPRGLALRGIVATAGTAPAHVGGLHPSTAVSGRHGRTRRAPRRRRARVLSPVGVPPRPAAGVELERCLTLPPGELRWTGLYSLKLTSPRRGKTTWAVLRCPMFNLQLEWPLSTRQAAVARVLAHRIAGCPGHRPGAGRSRPADALAVDGLWRD